MFRLFFLWLAVCTSACLGAAQKEAPPQEQPESSTPTFRVSAPLVVLDVTVVDRFNEVVTRGLDKADFRLTERNKPQQITVFEAPKTHDQENLLPATILVLDLLNTRFEDVAYLRTQAKKFLLAQPSKLKSPIELLVLGNSSLKAAHTFSSSRQELLDALQQIPPALPWKLSAAFSGERFVSSIDALRQIAAQNLGVEGRKNIVWLGNGGTGVYMSDLSGKLADEVALFVHETANMLVRARCSLFVIFPGISASEPSTVNFWNLADYGGHADPFAGDVTFASFAPQTGGGLYFRNDVAKEVQQARQLGSEYYTLGYRPTEPSDDGKFVTIHVDLSKVGLHALTKSGYYAPDGKRHQDEDLDAVVEEVRSTIPSDNIGVTVSNVSKPPGSGQLHFTVTINPHDLKWQPDGSGGNILQFRVASAALNRAREILASRSVTARVRSSKAVPGAPEPVVLLWCFRCRLRPSARE